jgi:arginyl-tRNA synthetase
MFRAFRAEVTACLREALTGMGHPDIDVGLEEPPGQIDAGLASNVAFRLAEHRGEAPPDVAAAVADAVAIGDRRYIAEVTTAGPYINFTTTGAYLSDTVTAAMTEGWGQLEPTGTSVIIEHTSANPTGPIHVGRARNPIFGDALARLLRAAGATVERHYYVNDAGRQVATFTWAAERFAADALPEAARDRPDHQLVRYYQHGSSFLEEADPAEVAEATAAIDAIMQGLEAGDQATYERVHAVIDPVLTGMAESLERLGVHFDAFIEETRFIRDGSADAIIGALQELPASDREDGAWVLDLSEVGIDKELVFVRGDGTSLYTTRDLAYHRWKLEEFDEAVTVLGEDHKLQAEQLRATLRLLGVDTTGLAQPWYSWVTLPEGGMSTRAGTGINLDDLLDEAVRRARAEVVARDPELGAETIDAIAHAVGVGAVRYDIISKQPTKGITFDWDRALDVEAQSAPYVQYAHARASGIVDAASDAGIEPRVETAVITRPVERTMVQTIARYPMVIEEAAAELAPHTIATYVRECAEEFNQFYRKARIIGADDPEVAGARLAIVHGAQATLASGLGLLGVEAPEVM